MSFWPYAFWIAAGYCSGSVLYAWLLPKIFRGMDISETSEDKNPGTFNAIAQTGLPLGLTALLLELITGFLPVFIALRRLPPEGLAFGMVLTAPVVGHMFPLWRGFRGGKAVAVSFGCRLGLLPGFHVVWILAFFYVLYSLVIKISPHGLRSCAAYVCFGAACLLLEPNMSVKLGCAAVALLVTIMHFASAKAEWEMLREEKKVSWYGGRK